MGYELPNSGEILKELRKKENYTQEYVARQLGVEVKTYRSWEIGYYKNNIQLFPTINSDKLIKIADLYNVSIDYILGRSSITQVDNTYIHSKIGLSENSIITLEKAKKDFIDKRIKRRSLEVLKENKILEIKKQKNWEAGGNSPRTETMSGKNPGG